MLLKEDSKLYRMVPDNVRSRVENCIVKKEERTTMNELFMTLAEWCAMSEKPIVLIIDEIDSATNNQVFLDFLALLRDRYIKRERKGLPAFQSVILAGVTDVRYLKSKIREDPDAGESRFAEELRGDAIDNKPEFIKNGELDIPLIMERFIMTQEYIRNLSDEEAEKRFIEDEGREKFLTYLSPIINGVGTFGVEEQNRDRRRMDVVIHYRGKRYIIEMKIWHGDRYNAKGEKQIIDYLDSYGLDTGYLLSFSFNKTKQTGVKELHIGGKTVYEGIV